MRKFSCIIVISLTETRSWSLISVSYIKKCKWAHYIVAIISYLITRLIVYTRLAFMPWYTTHKTPVSVTCPAVDQHPGWMDKDENKICCIIMINRPSDSKYGGMITPRLIYKTGTYSSYFFYLVLERYFNSPLPITYLRQMLIQEHYDMVIDCKHDCTKDLIACFKKKL